MITTAVFTSFSYSFERRGNTSDLLTEEEHDSWVLVNTWISIHVCHAWWLFWAQGACWCWRLTHYNSIIYCSWSKQMNASKKILHYLKEKHFNWSVSYFPILLVERNKIVMCNRFVNLFSWSQPLNHIQTSTSLPSNKTTKRSKIYKLNE